MEIGGSMLLIPLDPISSYMMLYKPLTTGKMEAHVNDLLQRSLESKVKKNLVTNTPRSGYRSYLPTVRSYF